MLSESFNCCPLEVEDHDGGPGGGAGAVDVFTETQNVVMRRSNSTPCNAMGVMPEALPICAILAKYSPFWCVHETWR